MRHVAALLTVSILLSGLVFQDVSEAQPLVPYRDRAGLLIDQVVLPPSIPCALVATSCTTETIDRDGLDAELSDVVTAEFRRLVRERFDHFAAAVEQFNDDVRAGRVVSARFREVVAFAHPDTWTGQTIDYPCTSIGTGFGGFCAAQRSVALHAVNGFHRALLDNRDLSIEQVWKRCHSASSCVVGYVRGQEAIAGMPADKATNVALLIGAECMVIFSESMRNDIGVGRPSSRCEPTPTGGTNDIKSRGERDTDCQSQLDDRVQQAAVGDSVTQIGADVVELVSPAPGYPGSGPSGSLPWSPLAIRMGRVATVPSPQTFEPVCGLIVVEYHYTLAAWVERSLAPDRPPNVEETVLAIEGTWEGQVSAKHIGVTEVDATDGRLCTNNEFEVVDARLSGFDPGVAGSRGPFPYLAVDERLFQTEVPTRFVQYLAVATEAPEIVGVLRDRLDRLHDETVRSLEEKWPSSLDEFYESFDVRFSEDTVVLLHDELSSAARDVYSADFDLLAAQRNRCP